MKNLTKLFLIATSALAPMAILTGCGTGVVPGSSNPVTGPAVQTGNGDAFGGQQPIQGMTINIYAVNTNGYGLASTKLTNGTPILTNQFGNFTYSAFTCPTQSTLTYVLGTGGNVIPTTGGSVGVANPNVSFILGVGPCSDLLTKQIHMNEVTTIATVWALSQFMTDSTHISTSSTNLTGLTNAFASISKLANINTGNFTASTSSATLPVAELNTIANIMQQCVNSTGGVASDATYNSATHTFSAGTNCGKLFSLTNPSGTAPTDTVTAMMNMAQNPASNVAGLNNLQSASPQFTNGGYLAVGSPPNAWTVAIQYAATSGTSPSAIAADQSGNIWVGEAAGIGLFAPTGTQSNYITANLTSPAGIAVDPSGVLWVADTTGKLVSVTNTGATASYSGNGLATPAGVAVDGSGDVWVANSTGGISEFSNTGAAITTFSSGSGLSNPAAIAISPK